MNSQFNDEPPKLDKSRCEIRICEFHHIRHIFERYHYKKGAMGGGISACFAMFLDGKLVGGSVLGAPRHENAYPECIDIRRMACTDDAPCNSESWFLAQIIKWCASNTSCTGVLSYSDATVGHTGTIYKAANFQMVGQTAASVYVEWNGRTYHPRSLSIDRPYSAALREAVSSGVAHVLKGEPKTIWLYRISKRQKSKRKVVRSIDVDVNQLYFF